MGRLVSPARRRVLRLTAGAVVLPALTRIAGAQTYPSRPVHIVVGLPPGLTPGCSVINVLTSPPIAGSDCREMPVTVLPTVELSVCSSVPVVSTVISCVTAPTVSRMVKSLVALRFVRQDRDEDDGRERLVVLTRRGIERIRAAGRRFIEKNTAEFALSCALGGVERWWDVALVAAAMSQLHGLLLRIRDAFWDTSGLLYPPPDG